MTVNTQYALGVSHLSTFPPIRLHDRLPNVISHITHNLLARAHNLHFFRQPFIITYYHQRISYQHIYRFKMKLQLLLLSTFSNMYLLVSAGSLRGLNSEDDGRDSRIIGGNEATPNFHSFAASLQDGQGHFCGGSLIGKVASVYHIEYV